MEGIIVYKGKYGSTQTYAGWLSEALQLPVLEAGKISRHDLEKYDFLILGSAVYFGKLLLHKWLKEHLALIHYKKIFIFSVSGTPPDHRQELDEIIQRSVPAEIRNPASVYFFPGKMELDKLSWLDRLLMKLGARMSKDPVVKKEMLREYNDVRKQHISELTQAVLQYRSPGASPETTKASQQQGLAH